MGEVEGNLSISCRSKLLSSRRGIPFRQVRLFLARLIPILPLEALCRIGSIYGESLMWSSAPEVAANFYLGGVSGNNRRGPSLSGGTQSEQSASRQTVRRCK